MVDCKNTSTSQNALTWQGVSMLITSLCYSTQDTKGDYTGS
jgi:hypothetical protein